MSFEKYLSNKGFSPSSIQRFIQWELSFKHYFSSIEIEKISYQDLMNYLLYKQKQGIKRATLLHILNRIKQYYAYQKLENPLSDFKLKGYKKSKETIYLSEQQLVAIYQIYTANPKLNPLSKIAIGLLIFQGINISEVYIIWAKNLKIKKQRIIIQALYLAYRELPLHPLQIALLKELLISLNQRDRLINLPEIDRPQNRHAHWKNQIKKELAKAKSTIPFYNLTQLRASRIALWIQSQGILQAQYLAGHQSIVSTESYQNQEDVQLRAALESVHPQF